MNYSKKLFKKENKLPPNVIIGDRQAKYKNAMAGTT